VKLLFDLTTPKTTLFFHALGSALRARSHEVHYVSREYRETNDLQKRLRVDVTIVGRHAGPGLADKAVASAQRQLAMVDLFVQLKPDVVACLSSVEASRAAFALGIPIACFNDFPEAIQTAKLSLPLATTVLAPAAIPVKTFEAMGAARVFSYNSFDPLAWLPTWDLAAWPLDVRGPDHTRTIVFRESETKAAYMTNQIPPLIDAVRTLAARHPDWLFVGIPRYSPERLRERLPASNVVIRADVVNTIGLVSTADLFLGGGGTMNIESAYFGTPTLCCRPMSCVYEQWLLDRGLAHKPVELTASGIVAMAEALVGRRNDPSALRNLPFPIDQVAEEIERLHDA
jgi:predicted glycosyltransferase